MTPHLLNVDFTFPLFNWRMYGQLPDIFVADPCCHPIYLA
jgi:hypothetical protein